MDNQVQVSIYCLAYNHEKYIRQCLDGFLMQKDVTLEIIIHDDASTDHTADIIREYENRYPELFKPIYQTENQYSKHVDIVKEYIVPLITGKYVAMCEGDDYWTDPYKLKKQYDALESNPDCYMCLHKVKVVKEDGSDAGRYYPLIDIPSGRIESNAFFAVYEKTRYYQTSGFFFRSEKYISYRNNPPEFKNVAPVGDEPILLYFAFIGNVYYVDETMSNYRFQSQGSWSSRINDNNIEKSFIMRDNYIKGMRTMLMQFSSFSNGKYDDDLSFHFDSLNKMKALLLDDKYWYCIQNKDYNRLFNLFSHKELKNRGLSNKAILKMKLQICFPKLFN